MAGQGEEAVGVRWVGQVCELFEAAEMVDVCIETAGRKSIKVSRWTRAH